MRILSKRIRHLLLLVIFVFLLAGCGTTNSVNTEPNVIDENMVSPIEAEPTEEVEAASPEPAASESGEEAEAISPEWDAELEEFAEEFLTLHYRLAEGTLALLTATDEEWPAAVDAMVALNEDVMAVDVPEDNEVAVLLMVSMGTCTNNFTEGMSISDYIAGSALNDCSQYINLYTELMGEE